MFLLGHVCVQWEDFLVLDNSSTLPHLDKYVHYTNNTSVNLLYRQQNIKRNMYVSLITLENIVIMLVIMWGYQLVKKRFVPLIFGN